MENKEYLDLINYSLKQMDKGSYVEALEKFTTIANSDMFKKLKDQDRLFLKKRISWIQLSLGYYDEGWSNFTYNWLKNSSKFKKIKHENNSIKYLKNFEQIKNNEKILIWNDGGYGDYIYQLRLLKYIKKITSFQIYTSKMDHLIRDKKTIASTSKHYDWHLPLNEIPRILFFNPKLNYNFEYNYLIKPKKIFLDYNDHVALTYKTETSIHKSIDYKLLSKLFIKKNNTKFLILQNYLSSKEKLFFSNYKNVEFINDLDKLLLFNDTFNIINAVKYVISVDTAVTHIAGYLGKKNYLLLMYPSSFYWGYDKSVSSDYPNHIIIRQKETGKWERVINKLIDLIN